MIRRVAPSELAGTLEGPGSTVAPVSPPLSPTGEALEGEQTPGAAEAKTPQSPLGAWLFLVAGVALLGSVVLIPAYDDMDEVRWQRERARAFEAHRQLRLDRYGQYLAALDREEPALMTQLAAEHLNLIPADKATLQAAEPVALGRTVFAALEPPPLSQADGSSGLGERPRTGSLLERWTLDERVRPWLIAFGGLCLLIGLLPQAKPASSLETDEP
jgi:hypothetical protein